jgi:nitrite reductase (NADH) small subunit
MRATLLLEKEIAICNLGSVERIPVGEGRMFRLGRLSVSVFRARDGKVFATQSMCPHREGPLSDGMIGDDKVVCPLHSYKFSLRTGEPLGNDCEALKVYPVSVNQSGDILLALKESCFEEASVYEQTQRSACSHFGSANEQ